MFYTEYRPQKFRELIGAEHVIASVTGTLAKETPAHAYFFTGSRGTGKTTTARLLAKALNCQSPIITESGSVKFEPCGECESCLAIKKGNHLDLIEIDAASNRGIDNIRELRDGVSLSPSMGKRKIYIIDEVHMLTTEASNALLKTLEEPPEHVFFILCTTNPEKVLDTIKSRCLSLQFKRPTINDLVSKLSNIAKDKDREIAEDTLKKIAVAAKGAFREAETLLEQFISDESELDSLLSSTTDNYAEFFAHLLSNDRASSINLIHGVYESGKNLENWTEKLVAYLRELLLNKIGITNSSAEYIFSEADKSLMSRASEADLKKSIENFTKAMSEFRHAVVPTLPLELAVLEITSKEEKAIQTEAAKPEVKEKTTTQPTQQPKAQSTEAATVNKLDIRIKKTPGDRPSPKQTADEDEEPVEKPNKSVKFSYKELVDAVKPKNHAIHLILHSCQLVNFDGKYLDLRAFYSFHKERLLSTKIRETIQDVAANLTGSTVVLRCELSDKNPDAKKLTDKNIVTPSTPQAKAELTEVFEKVFGDDLAISSE